MRLDMCLARVNLFYVSKTELGQRGSYDSESLRLALGAPFRIKTICAPFRIKTIWSRNDLGHNQSAVTGNRRKNLESKICENSTLEIFLVLQISLPTDVSIRFQTSSN
jgi:hypothetical protein